MNSDLLQQGPETRAHTTEQAPWGQSLDCSLKLWNDRFTWYLWLPATVPCSSTPGHHRAAAS